MIQLINVSKKYPTRNGWTTVLNDVNLTLKRGQKLGVLGRNGAGKSTLIRLMSGAEPPSSGKIIRDMSISWPLAFSGGFQGSLTGIDNLKFICRVYGADYQKVRDYVEDFAELGKYMYEPLKSYSSGMRARLAFGLSMAIEFDCYLIDEVMAVGDQRFKDRCRIELFEKRKDRAMIFVSHSSSTVKKVCDSACVLDKGTLYSFRQIDEAFDFYEKISN